MSSLRGLMHRLTHPQQTADRISLLMSLRKFDRMNRSKQTPVTSPGGPVISLTTYSKRIHTVHLTLESIGRGEMLPSRLILYLDEKPLLENLPESIKRLQRRGLEVLPSENYGPYKKYYPYVASQDVFEKPLVTADDDVLYPPAWLRGLATAYGEYPTQINAYRARIVALDETGIAKYTEFKLCTTTSASTCHMATGVSGVIYPPAFQAVLKQAGTGFSDCCPRNDDLWLHVNAVREGYKIRQITTDPKEFPEIPGTQDIALHLENVSRQDGNDRQIKATYQEADIARLRVACAADCV